MLNEFGHSASQWNLYPWGMRQGTWQSPGVSRQGWKIEIPLSPVGSPSCQLPWLLSWLPASPCHSSPPSLLLLLLFYSLYLSFSVQLSFTLMYFFLYLPPCSFSLPVSPTILSLYPFDFPLYSLLCRRLSVRHKLCSSSFQHSILLCIVVTPFSPHVAQLNKTSASALQSQ